MGKFSLEDFQSLLKTDTTFKDTISTMSDVVDFDNGSMMIHRNNISKYLEKYMCKDENDFEDTMWFNYGVFVKIVD